MRTDGGPTATTIEIDLAKNRNYTLGHQIDHIVSCKNTNSHVGVVKQLGEHYTTGSDSIQSQDDFVQQTENLVLAVGIQKLVIENIGQPGAEDKAANKALARLHPEV